MMNIQVNNGIAEVNGYEGHIESADVVDSDFIHLTLSGITLGITPSETTINNEYFESVESFADKLNSLITI
jgi:hypothetical protein